MAADQVFRKVLELDPENVIAFKVLADLAERSGRFSDAVIWLTKLLAADPMNGDAAEGGDDLRDLRRSPRAGDIRGHR